MAEIDEMERQQVAIEIIGPLGEAARGTMGKEVSDERAAEVAEAIPQYMTAAEANEPETCMDDRHCARLMSKEPAPVRNKMAGGLLQSSYGGARLANATTYQTIVAEELGSVQKEKQQYQDAVLFRALGKRTAAHTSTHAEGDASDCGASDKEPEAISLLAQSGQLDGPIPQFTAYFMRVPFNETLHQETIVPRAQAYADALRRDHWVGRDLLKIVANPKPYDTVDAQTGAKDIEILEDEHDPELFVVCQEPLTLDRDRFVEEFGAKVLWVDEDAIWNEAHDQTPDESEALELYQSMMTLQVAFGLTLGAGHLRAGIIRRAA